MSTHRQQHGRQGETGQRSRRTRTYRTAVELPPETRESVVGMLNATLADATDLMTQAKVAHWNVKGMNFYQLHLLFDEIAETFEEHVDIVAERITALGGEATGSVRDAAANTHVPALPPDATTGREYVEALVERVGIHANSLRRDIEVAVEYDDEDTADLYTELSREVDEQLYFLEAHLQAVEPEAVPQSPGAPNESRPPTRNQQSTEGRQSTSGQQSMGGQQSMQGGQQSRTSPSQYRRESGGAQGGQRGTQGGPPQYGGQLRRSGQFRQSGTRQSSGRGPGY